jgi:hypothetical protein
MIITAQEIQRRAAVWVTQQQLRHQTCIPCCNTHEQQLEELTLVLPASMFVCTGMPVRLM